MPSAQNHNDNHHSTAASPAAALGLSSSPYTAIWLWARLSIVSKYWKFPYGSDVIQWTDSSPSILCVHASLDAACEEDISVRFAPRTAPRLLRLSPGISTSTVKYSSLPSSASSWKRDPAVPDRGYRCGSCCQRLSSSRSAIISRSSG